MIAVIAGYLILVLLFVWVGWLIYKKLNPTNFAPYLGNMAQVAIIVVTGLSFILVYFQTDRNFRQTVGNSDRQFQLASRPYLQVIPKSLVVVGPADRGGKLPEIEFNFSANIVNHGQLPASTGKVEVVIQSNDDPEAVCPFMPWEMNQKMTDVFPYKETVFNDFFGNIFLNLNDAGRIMKVDSSFVRQHSDKTSPFWKEKATDIAKAIQGQLGDFFMIIQIEYKTAGDLNNETLYYHSTKFKIHPNSPDRLSDIEESINGASPEQGKWFEVNGGSVKPYSKTAELPSRKLMPAFGLPNAWNEDVKNILLNILGGFITVALTGLFSYVRRQLRLRDLRAVFGQDIVSAVRSHIVYAEFLLRSEVQGRETHPYRKPAGGHNIFSIENPVSGCEARSANYLISTLSKEGGRFPSFVPDTQVQGLLDISFITLGGPASNLKTNDAMLNEGNGLVRFDQANHRMVRVGENVPLFQREHGFDYGLILKFRPQQFPERVWIVCAGFSEWGSSGAAWYLSQNWKKIHDRWKSAPFAIIVKVRFTQDESAEPILQI
ncbi:MAG: hypothetical protein HYZ83_06885 [Candidatus Omnitrophica bacterium]|nr:hypothetical protein [Candidatus Omnitrophota bacterium]